MSQTESLSVSYNVFFKCINFEIFYPKTNVFIDTVLNWNYIILFLEFFGNILIKILYSTFRYWRLVFLLGLRVTATGHESLGVRAVSGKMSGQIAGEAMACKYLIPLHIFREICLEIALISWRIPTKGHPLFKKWPWLVSSTRWWKSLTTSIWTISAGFIYPCNSAS
jgi:hypothetical protein